MPFIVMQQVQPDAVMVAQQSQQAWIIAQQLLSPLVQVMHTPMSVASHLHMPIVMLQQQTIMPFIIMQQLHIPPAIIVHRFWSMPAETLSSQTQVTFIPPVHFSNVILQRGTIIMFEAEGAAAAGPVMPMPVMPITFRSAIIVFMVSFLIINVSPAGTTVDPPTLKSHSILAHHRLRIKGIKEKILTDDYHKPDQDYGVGKVGPIQSGDRAHTDIAAVTGCRGQYGYRNHC